VTKRAGEKTEGDEEEGGRAGGGCLPPLNPLVLALNMIQMLSSLLFRSPVSHPTATAAAVVAAAAAHEPRATILTPPPPPHRSRPSLPPPPPPPLSLSLSFSLVALLPPPTSSLV